MAARTKGRTAGFQMGAEHRSKIGNSKVLGELLRFAEGDIPPDEYPPHRVTAALGLLRKVMPDMTESMIKGEGEDGAIVVQVIKGLGDA